MTLELHATPEEVMRAVEALREFARLQQIPEKTAFELALAMEESASNVVNHALRRDARQTFLVTFGRAGDEIFIELRDRGPEFDPTASAEGGPAAGGADPFGGWGIQLVRRYMDTMHYKREEGENILRLSKRPGAGPQNFGNPSQNTPKRKGNEYMPLEIQIQKSIGAHNDGAVTVRLAGSLDTATAPELERQLAPVLSDSVKDIVFDLGQLKFVSSAGLRVFAATRKALKERHGQACFVNMQPQIQEVFEIIKALPGVAIFKDEAEFDGYLAARQRSHAENT